MFDSINWLYVGILAGGAVLCTALYALYLKKYGKKTAIAWAALPMGAVLGVALSKLVYLIMTQATYLSVHGFPVSSPAPWSVFGGLFGVYLGVWLAGRLLGEKGNMYLELFAPFGMLLIAVMRAAEFSLEQYGLGELVQNEALQFFPVCWSVSMWGRSVWYMAVFVWEAVWALLLFVLCLIRQGKCGPSRAIGLSMTLFYFCLGQMLFESLRVECIRLGFLRLEQLLSAVICFALVCVLCKQYQNAKNLFVRWLPALLTLCGIGAMVGWMFALDEPSYTRWVVYALIILTLAGMGAVYVWAEKRVLNKGEGGRA